MDLGTATEAISWWAVLAAAVSMFVLGGAWYGALFARRWQELVGLADDEVAAGTVRVFGIAGVASLVIAGVLGLFIGADAGVADASLAGLLAGLGWVAPALAMSYAFARRPTGLTVIDAGYHVLAFTLAAALLGWLG
ncbi:MAG TPA: DUF1761 domain-containing protein [Nitriliruptoraceae bacterium]|nr:DUF1761 domain-containing protein [Nitriliruptoraceae bacterium]